VRATQETYLGREELQDAWDTLEEDERVDAFLMLTRDDADDFFSSLPPQIQAQILWQLPEGLRRTWMRTLAPDDAADLLQEVTPEERVKLLALLDGPTRREVTALLAYEEDVAGGLMSPRFARLRPDLTVGEALQYLRRQTPGQVETIYYAFVLDSDQRLRGVISLRELVISPDNLLGKHFAVLGTTGCGKSCAVTLILRAILEQHPNAHVVLLDPHNEYPSAFGDIAEIIGPESLQLPY
jgi:Mg/Co/Ni transporter MgtE